MSVAGSGVGVGGEAFVVVRVGVGEVGETSDAFPVILLQCKLVCRGRGGRQGGEIQGKRPVSSLLHAFGVA